MNKAALASHCGSFTAHLTFKRLKEKGEESYPKKPKPCRVAVGMSHTPCLSPMHRIGIWRAVRAPISDHGHFSSLQDKPKRVLTTRPAGKICSLRPPVASSPGDASEHQVWPCHLLAQKMEFEPRDGGLDPGPPLLGCGALGVLLSSS